MKAIASHNGLAAARRAYELLVGGTSPLDACVEGVTLVEDDPEEITVGYGGLPNEDGVVELDAAVMDGATGRGAGVAALRGIRHPTKVARLLLQKTTRVLLVGEGAVRFARANGFVEEDLLTDKARRMWLHWRRTRDRQRDWLPPTPQEADLDVQAWFEKYFYRPSGGAPGHGPEGSAPCAAEGSSTRAAPGPGDPSCGTVHVAAISSAGDVACATSTSGHAFKLAGRVGDSPILGAGLYADNGVGSCGSIGHGETNLENLSSFLAVERMRGGHSPLEAGMEVLRRVAARAAPHQRDSAGRAAFNLQLFLLDRDGGHAGVAMWGPKQLAVCDQNGPRLEDCAALYDAPQ
jgi:N4-(beta-N-acetylglucosaminyl)-L-asparaginase